MESVTRETDMKISKMVEELSVSDIRKNRKEEELSCEVSLIGKEAKRHASKGSMQRRRKDKRTHEAKSSQERRRSGHKHKEDLEKCALNIDKSVHEEDSFHKHRRKEKESLSKRGLKRGKRQVLQKKRQALAERGLLQGGGKPEK